MPTAVPTPAEDNTSQRFPRARDHLAPRPWVSTTIALLVFVLPGGFCTLATVIGDDWIVAGFCAAWAMIGLWLMWFVWTQRRRNSHAAFYEAMDRQPIVAILAGLEAEDLDVDEAVDIVEYLREQRMGWSRTVAAIDDGSTPRE